jgi:hypothetical protein
MTAGDYYGDPLNYRGYRIYRNDFLAHPRWAEVSWLYQHEDYDPTPTDSEGPPGDNRAGACSSVDACKQEIDWLIEDGEDGNQK